MATNNKKMMREKISQSFRDTLARYEQLTVRDPKDSEDSDYEVMETETSNVFSELVHQNKYFTVPSLPFDTNAPYYAELQKQFRIGATPLNPTGMKSFVIRLADILPELEYNLYTEAATTLFKVYNLDVTIVPSLFISDTLGSATYKMTQGEYFESELHPISKEYDYTLNQEVTGVDYSIPVTDKATTLATPLFKLDYRWHSLRTTRSLVDGTSVFLAMLVKASLQPIIGA